MLKYILLLFVSISPLAFCDAVDLDKTKESAHEKLESGFEKTALGSLEITIGVLCATRGEIAGAASLTMHGMHVIKDGVNDFRQAKELYDNAREIERQIELNDITYGAHDREY